MERIRNASSLIIIFTMVFTMMTSTFAISVSADEAKTEIVWLRGGEKATYNVDSDKITYVSGNEAVAKLSIENKKLLIEGTARGEVSYKVGDTIYETRVYAPLYWRMVDITDPDNHTVIQGKEVITRYWDEVDKYNELYSDEIYAQIYDLVGYEYVSPTEITPIEGRKDVYSFAGQATGYIYGERDYYGEIIIQDVYFTQAEEGSYRVSFMYDDSDNPIGFKDVVDKDGKPATGVDGTKYIITRGQAFIDGQRVWCIEPEVATFTGNAYEKETAKENIRAALAVLFGGDKDEITSALTQAMIWQTVGYPNMPDNPVHITPSYDLDNPVNEVALDESEKAEYDATRAVIEEAIKLYESDAKVGFVSKTPETKVVDGKIIIDKSAKIDKIVLEATNKSLLDFYATGRLDYPEGITGEVNSDEGTLTLTIDLSQIKDSSKITMSMIPADFDTETVLFKSNYGRQSLMKFGISDPKTEELGIALGDVPAEDNKDKEKEQGVNTGDTTNIMLYSGLMFTALVAIMFTLYRRFRTKK